MAYPTLVQTNEKGTTKEYLVANFIYDKESDSYVCPQNQTLKTKGSWHKNRVMEVVISSKNTAVRLVKNVS